MMQAAKYIQGDCHIVVYMLTAVADSTRVTMLEKFDQIDYDLCNDQTVKLIVVSKNDTREERAAYDQQTGHTAKLEQKRAERAQRSRRDTMDSIITMSTNFDYYEEDEPIDKNALNQFARERKCHVYETSIYKPHTIKRALEDAVDLATGVLQRDYTLLDGPDV